MQIPPTAPVVQPPRSVAARVDVRPLAPTASGTLRLGAPDALGRDFVSAASGIAAAGGVAWAVSDEYGELARFERLDQPGTLVPGLSRQKGKPDLEAIVRLPALDAGGGAALLALGSGSAPRRDRGLLQSVDASGRGVGAARAVDLSALFAAFDARLPQQPNIEGAAWRDGRDGAELLVFHRGKATGDVNTIFRLDGRAVLGALRSGSAVPVSAIRGQLELDLGSLGGERLGFADARALPDGRIAFIASAEGGAGTGDGRVMGSVFGMLDADLQLTALRPLTGAARKVEGLELARELDPAAPADRLVLVTDPDEPQTPTEVLTVDALGAG